MNYTAPLIKEGWIRVFVFCVLFLALQIAGGFIVLLALTLIKNTSSVFRILLIIIYNLISGVGLVFIFRKFIDRQSVYSLGWNFSQHKMHAAIGFCAAALIIAGGTLLLAALKYLHFTGWYAEAEDLYISFGIMVMVAVVEELVFRGYILNNLMQSVNRYAALLISSILFALAHATNPNFNWLAFVNIFLAGIILGINYIYTQNLWYAVLFHFAWNFLQGPVIGYEVSGLDFQSIFQLELTGNEIITGGKFGFEGSIVASLLIITVTLIQAYVYEKKLKAAAIQSSPVSSIH